MVKSRPGQSIESVSVKGHYPLGVEVRGQMIEGHQKVKF